MRFTSDQNVSSVNVDIAINYGQGGNFNGFEMGTNLLNPEVPEFKPFIEEDGKSLIAEDFKLRGLAGAFFKLPEELSWYPVMEAPREDAKVVGVYGKFGSSDILNPVIQFRLKTDGSCEISVLRSLLAIKGETTP